MSINRRIATLCEPVERGQTIVEFLTNSTTDGLPCTNSDELSRVVNEGRIDAIVICQRLSGFLSGIDIIAKLSKDLVRPVTILVGDLSPEDKERAAALKVNEVLPESSTSEAIASSALSALTQEIHGGLSIPQGARMLVRDSNCVAPMPQLLVRLADFLGNPRATFSELAKEILTDARITAELLKIVNNASNGLAGKVTKVEDAVKMLGVKRTVSLVLSKHLLSGSLPKAKPLPNGLEHRLRQRNVLTASTAATYAKMTGSAASDTAYVLGLLQDLGILILLHELGNKYFHALERCATIPQLQLHSYELRELGFTHAHVSAAVLQKWELPPRLIRLVLQHHDPIDTVQASSVEVDLVKAMQIGEAFADCREQSSPQRQMHLNRLVGRFGQMDIATFRSCLGLSIARTLEMSQVFGVPIPNESALQQIVQRIAAEVDYPLPDTPEVSTTPQREESAPASHPTQRPDGAGPAAFPTPPSPYIVVIDDEPAVPRLIERMLAGRGIHVVGCADFSGLSQLAGDARAILCDVHLNGQSGIEVVRALREFAIRTPILMISGDRSRVTVLESIAAGVDGYLPKPFDQRTLLEKLDPYLQRNAAIFESASVP